MQIGNKIEIKGYISEGAMLHPTAAAPSERAFILLQALAVAEVLRNAGFTRHLNVYAFVSPMGNHLGSGEKETNKEQHKMSSRVDVVISAYADETN